MPVLLFRNLAHTEFPATLPWGLWISYYGAMLAVWAAGSLVALYVLRRPAKDSVMLGFGCGQGNTIMLGLPIILTGFGPEAGTPVFLILAFHGIILFAIATFLLELTRVREGEAQPRFRAIFKEGLLNTAKNPVIIGIAGGVIYGQLVVLPLDGRRQLARNGGALGDPLCAFRAGRHADALRHPAFDRRGVDDEPLQARRASGAGVCAGAIRVRAGAALGRGGDDPCRSMPTGVYSSILANRYGAAPGAASSAVVLSTAASLITLTVLLGFFSPPPSRRMATMIFGVCGRGDVRRNISGRTKKTSSGVLTTTR